MKKSLLLLIFSLALSHPASSKETKDNPKVEIQVMKGFPNNEQGIEQGVSACYATMDKNRIIMAGGCNFPEVPAAKGGKKKYYQGIYMAKNTNGKQLKWKKVGNLPQPAAYGVSIATKQGMICIGGNNEKESLNKVYEITIHKSKCEINPLPDLPEALDNMAGCKIGKEIFVTGKNEVYKLDLNDLKKGWTPYQSIQGRRRLQPVCGSADRDFCMWGGFATKTEKEGARLYFGGVKFGKGKEKEILKNPTDPRENPIFLGGAAAINIHKDKIICVGGVNKDIFLQALNNPPTGYMEHPNQWYEFNKYILIYSKKQWHIIGKSEHTARAGATLTTHKNRVFVIGGELKPGIRTPKIIKLTLKK